MHEKNLASISTDQRVANQCICCGSTALERSPAVLMPFISHRVFGWSPVEITEAWGLHTIKPGMAYSLCNSLLCTNCHLIFLDIRFNDDELSKLYRNYRDEDYTQLRDSYEPGYRIRNAGLQAGIKYLDDVEAFIRSVKTTVNTVLDWGGNDGSNTPFKSSQRTVDIYDIGGAQPVAGARLVDTEHVNSNQYDVIVCSNVLEHVPYPTKFLQEIKSVMRSGTVLYIEIPLEEIMLGLNSPHEKLEMKRHWHEHINFFSERAMTELLNHCGLKLVRQHALRPQPNKNTATLLQIACTLP